MHGMNCVNLTGHVGGDPVLRTTQGGKSVCELRLCINRPVKQGDTWGEVADWFSVICWDRSAESVARFVQKGSLIGVVGSLRTQTWQDREGNNRSKVVIQADRVLFLSTRPGDQGDQGHDGGDYDNQGQQGQGNPGPGEEIPF